jgi:hypothetical protein
MTAEKLYTSLLMLEDYSRLFPDESLVDNAIEMLSETDWAQPLKPLAANTKQVFYSFFGQQPKLN